MKLESLKSPKFEKAISCTVMSKILGGAPGEGATGGGESTVYGQQVKFDADFRGVDSRGKFYMEYRLNGREVACWNEP